MSGPTPGSAAHHDALSFPAGAGGALGALVRRWRGLVRFLQAFTGEDRWAAHVRACASHGHPPGSRRDFERRRADAAAATPVQRCC